MLVCQGTLVNPGIRLTEVTSKRATSVSPLRKHPPEVDPGTRLGSAAGTGLERVECVCYQTYERRYVANGMKPTKQGSMLAQCARHQEVALLT